ncbi:MAG: phospholipase D-like domain-containing protein [Smithella sp.]|jgi:phosphatidylserine/phosphatidylglycerophosphate/cardiolipin synthase-like enzyme|nr:phospholipase D-like domain-containing protein [Smithella sp.]MDD5524381.1 phospholipase D-like domain-containing protein [Smithella sp.]
MNRISFGKKIIAVLFAGIVLIATAVFCAAASKKSGQNSPAGSQAVILTNEDYLPALLRTIDEAQNEIFISIFSFKAGEHKNSYPDRILDHLAKALKRGVKVYVILETTDRKSDELNIQNKQTGKLLEEKGVNVYFDSPRQTTHTKLVVIDQRLVLLGSHNFTQSALKYNNEISILLDSPEMAQNARNYILRIIKEAK